MLTRMKQDRIDHMLNQVETAATVERAKAAGIRHDWRAADRLLAVIAPERFSQVAQVSQDNRVQVVINESSRAKVSAMIEEALKQPAIDCPPATAMPPLPDAKA